MPLTPDIAAFQIRLAALPLSTTGRLLILKEGTVEVVKEGIRIAKVTEPGAVLGELSVLLDKPHTADVRALEASQFHVADAAALLRKTRAHSSTLRRSSHSVSTVRITLSSR